MPPLAMSLTTTIKYALDGLSQVDQVAFSYVISRVH